MEAEFFFQKCMQSSKVHPVGSNASANYSGSSGNASATAVLFASAIAGNTASATANGGHPVTSDLYIRRWNLLMSMFGLFLIAKLWILFPGSTSCAGHEKDARPNLVDMCCWGLNNVDTLKYWLPRRQRSQGPIYSPLLPHKCLNLTKHTNKKVGARCGLNNMCGGYARQGC